MVGTCPNGLLHKHIGSRRPWLARAFLPLYAAVLIVTLVVGRLTVDLPSIQSVSGRRVVLALPFGDDALSRFERLAERSLEEQRALEIGDTLSFEEWRQAYLAPVRLR